MDKKEDNIKRWANEDFAQWFKSAYVMDVLGEYSKIIKWIEISNFKDKAKKDFTDKKIADALVIAYAKARGYTVVTHEQYKPGIKRKIPIPNVCSAFDIQSLYTFQMLRELGIQL